MTIRANMSFPTTPSFNRNEQTRFINQLITLNGHTLIPRHFLYIYLRNRLLMGSFSRFTNKAHSPLRPSLFAVFRTGFGGGWRSPRCVFGALGSKRIVRLFCVCAPGVIYPRKQWGIWGTNWDPTCFRCSFACCLLSTINTKINAFFYGTHICTYGEVQQCAQRVFHY